MKNIKVIDTSVIMYDPLFYKNFGDAHLVIPIQALEELSKNKNKPGLAGPLAMEALRQLKKLFNVDVLDVSVGIPLENGGFISAELNHMDLSVLPDALDNSITDYRMVAVALNLNKDPDVNVTMVSNDMDIWVVCKSLGLAVEDYSNEAFDVDLDYDGVIIKEVSKEIIDKLYKETILDWQEDIFPNTGVILKSNQNSILTIFKDNKLYLVQDELKRLKYLSGRNTEQKFAISLLLDSKIPMVTITGGAGSGKTYLAISVAMHELRVNKKYNKILLIKSTEETNLGFLPGTELEKLSPYMASYYDAFMKIIPKYYIGIQDEGAVREKINELLLTGQIEMKNFDYLRGRSLDNTLIIVDESQQITPHFAKLVLTRVGLNTKIILTGDISDNQIDVNYVNSKSNGLLYLTNSFKSSKLAGHITLKTVERSPLAKEAERIL